MSQQQYPRKAVEVFKTLMEVFSPSVFKIIIFTVTLALFVGYLLISEQLALLKPLLLVYSLNRLSQAKNDIEYLSQEYFSDFPVRQHSGFAWETPDGQRIESERLNKHYSYRLVLMFIAFVLMILGLYLLKMFV